MKTAQVGLMYVPSEEHYVLNIISADELPDALLARLAPHRDNCAAFRVTNAFGPLPDRHYLSISLYLWSYDSQLFEFDEVSGCGRFQLRESVAPEIGDSIKLEVLEVDEVDEDVAAFPLAAMSGNDCGDVDEDGDVLF